jgi:hypothetical protein
MVIIVIAKITKLGWFEDISLVTTVKELVQLSKTSPKNCLIALQALDDLILEMGYWTKVNSLVANRRVSISFRDSGLYQIMEEVLNSLKSFN